MSGSLDRCGGTAVEARRLDYGRTSSVQLRDSAPREFPEQTPRRERCPFFRIKTLYITWILAAVPLGCFCLVGAAVSADPTIPDRPMALFNGTNLSGWSTWLVDTRKADPRGVFTVSNGLLRISGEGLGYLATDGEYRDYELVVEFKWGQSNWAWGDRVGRARDSGLFVHATGPDGNSHDGGGAFRAALECQIMQGAVGDILLIRGVAADGSLIAPRLTVEAHPRPDGDGWPVWHPGGARRPLVRWGRVNWSGKSRQWRDELDFRGSADVEGRTGEWTRIQCWCRGSGLAIDVNGKRVNEVTAIHPRQGAILLQCEGSEIFFRRVEVRPLRP